MNSYYKKDVQIQLHSFYEESCKAYAAVNYLCVVFPDKLFFNLITAETKVNPIKLQTLPHIELC